MPIYSAPVRDYLFVLDEVLNIKSIDDMPGYADLEADTISAIMSEAAKFCENELLPINLSGDEEGCTLNPDGTVSTPKGFKEAFDKYNEGGWMGLSAPEEYGGQGLPYIMGIVMEELMVSSNHSWAMYPGLTHGAMAAFEVTGSDDQKQRFLPSMTSGKWTGTMNLTEPHCGTDLGMLRTKAEPMGDGKYKISGSKIYISSGNHDMAENIIHLVLARTPDAPAGVKGISMFIVPRNHIDDDGNVGEMNAVSVGSLEDKMGIHGNSTCVMNYDGAVGELIGEEGKGLQGMFIMMNAARLGVGMQGLGHSEVAYQNAAAYANDRIQGRSLTGPKNPDGPADPIIVHPDVRRMLMNARSFNEGARLVAAWAALLVDRSMHHADEAEREKASDFVGLMTPIIKGVFTDFGMQNALECQQVFGGHGYVREWGMEQTVRDVRIAQIYEGTNGIQALDLVGRKLPAHGGRAIQAFLAEIQELIDRNKGIDGMADFTDPLAKGLGRLQAASMWLMQNAMANPDNAGSASYAYMNLMGRVVLGAAWTLIAAKCLETLEAGTDGEDFYKNKLIVGRYFMKWRMPETGTFLKQVEAGCEDLMAMTADAF